MANDAKSRAERRSWTCALQDFAGVYGTGALIGPDLVLTNFHVVQKLERDPSRLADARVHFDYLEQGARQSVGLAAAWLVTRSRYAKRDLNIEEPPEPENLDYAVIRLAAKIGDQPLPVGNLAGWPDGTRPARRGWLVLPVPETLPAAGVNISIYHHPCGYTDNRFESLPMESTPGKIISVDVGWLRVTHDAPTNHGSSGAICYGNNLEPVALHHAGDPESELGKLRPNQKPLPPGQRAIPLGAIAAQLSHLPDQSIYQSMLPPREEPVRTELGTTNEAIKQDILRRRHKRAMALLDRDDPEWNIIDSRNTRKSLVHAIACRSVDGPEFFMTRLREASLAFEKLPRPEIEERLSRFLNVGWTENGWRDGSATMDKRLAPTEAAAKIVREIDHEIVPDQGTVFVIEQTFDKFDAERERLIVTEVGRLCTPLLDAGRSNFQVFFVYQDDRPPIDGRDPSAKQRALVAKFWTDPPPAGCGQCLNFDDIDDGQMKRWISAIDRAYRINREELADRVDQIFAGRKMPFMTLETKLRNITKVYCQNVK
ncbi:serine protease [Mesorhizobium sp. M0768]|uniref:trypsin-like serine peptidase n=1 Tax=Mesorhizobium sp. M0768 TaxID=2956996 RepID=UPI00333C12BF